MTVETYIDGEFKALTEKPILLINGNGWYRYDLSLKEAVGSKDFQIAFRTHNYISYDMTSTTLPCTIRLTNEPHAKASGSPR